MNYEKIYKCLVKKCEMDNRGQIKQTGYELHHILPRSMGGSNNKDNLVKFTLREHFVAHRLLAKFTEGKAKVKMQKAIFLMCSSGVHPQRFNSRLFAKLKNDVTIALRRDRVETSKGTPDLYFPLGNFTDLFSNEMLLPERHPPCVDASEWKGRKARIFRLAMKACALGYVGLTFGGNNTAGLSHQSNSLFKLLYNKGMLSQGVLKTNVKVYTFTDKFITLCSGKRNLLSISILCNCLIPNDRFEGGNGYIKPLVINYNKNNTLKLVKLMWSKNDPYIKKINAWKGDLPNLILK